MKIKKDFVHLPMFPIKEMTMCAHQIMTRNAITVLPETPILEAAHKLLENHVSGLPVLDASGKLVGIVSEGDFLRRSEIGTQQKRPRWLQYSLSRAHSANDFIYERGRKVEDVMTHDPVVADKGTSLDEPVHLMENNGIKRLVCSDAGAKFCAIDREGHCFIALETQQNILKVWRKITANQQLLALNQEGLSAGSEPEDAITLNQAVDAAPPSQSAMNGDEATARPFE